METVLRIALVHDWLTGMRGGEKVLSMLCRLLPEADLLTLIHSPGSCDARIEAMPIRASMLNDLPGVRHYYRYLLPLMPLAIEQLDTGNYDLIMSSSYCVAKGVTCSPSSLHICYCHTPMRYAWTQAHTYTQNMGLSGLALSAVQPYLRAWDLRSVRHVDYFLANSLNVAKRIQHTYGRDAQVIYPPIDTEFFTPTYDNREDFYLMVTALAPYKQVAQAIEAFTKLGRSLLIIGSGQLFAQLRRGLPENVKLLGWQSNKTVRDHYRRCRAIIFPGEEDFGMVPLEAMACGTPVIAYASGGALETVIDINQKEGARAPTGLLYTPQTAEGLTSAVKQFEQLDGRFKPQQLVAWAQQFSPTRFCNDFKQLVGPLLSNKGLGEPW